jgi:poly(A) polymerase
MAMQPLSHQPWLTAPASRAVLAALAAERATPRFVGGCVRDGLLGQPSTDLDIAIDQRPEDNGRLLQTAGIKVIPTGLKHGTLTAITDGRKFEITTLRVDVKTFGRHAEVAFTDDWCRDAARRDFTINAIYADGDGQLFDPVGGGDDLAAGRVRFVGQAARRIEEDKLRILRFFRFQARFGRGEADAGALAACAEAAPGIDGLSGERVRQETCKILTLPSPRPCLDLMARTGVLQRILPTGFDLAALARCDGDPLRRLAAIAAGGMAGAEAIARRLRLSKLQTHRLAFLMAPPAQLDDAMERPALRQLLHDHGPDAIKDLAHQQGAAGLAARIAEAAPPPFPLSGRDAIALDMPAGAELGALLRMLEQTWRAGDFTAGRDELLAELRDLIELR